MDLFWEQAGWEEKDRHLSFLKKMPFERKFPFIPTAPGLYVIRGPRQIGKSSWLKSILHHYTELNSSCFYLSCEELDSYKELSEILRSVASRAVILLDEITFVKDWDRSVKHFIDSGFNGILVITGSHVHDLKTGADRMPGRFDGGGEFYLFPMDFHEFRAVRKQAGWSQSKLEDLQCYFRVGGFPIAVAEAGKLGKVPLKALQTYWKWLLGDVVRLGKQEAYLSEILIQVALTMQTPISYQGLAQKTRLGSHNTIQEYLSVLESCFAVRTLPAIDISTGAFRIKKNRKLYFTDPLIYWLALDLGNETVKDFSYSKLAEMCAHEYLARSNKRFGYFSADTGEIDFVSPKKWAIEVKWSPVATNLSKAYLAHVAPYKTVWTQESIFENMPDA